MAQMLRFGVTVSFPRDASETVKGGSIGMFVKNHVGSWRICSQAHMPINKTLQTVYRDFRSKVIIKMYI